MNANAAPDETPIGQLRGCGIAQLRKHLERPGDRAAVWPSSSCTTNAPAAHATDMARGSSGAPRPHGHKAAC